MSVRVCDAYCCVGMGGVEMTTFEEIKKALEGVTHASGKWEAEGTAVYCDDATGQRVCDTKGEYLFWSEEQKRNAAAYIAAVHPVAISELLSTLESLQRENEELRFNIQRTRKFAMDMGEACDFEIKVSEATRASVCNLRDELKNLLGAAEEVSRLGAVRGNQWLRLTGALLSARTQLSHTALASTGGEHHAE